MSLDNIKSIGRCIPTLTVNGESVEWTLVGEGFGTEVDGKFIRCDRYANDITVSYGAVIEPDIANWNLIMDILK